MTVDIKNVWIFFQNENIALGEIWEYLFWFYHLKAAKDTSEDKKDETSTDSAKESK